MRSRWVPYPITNKGVNLPDPVIPERIAVFDFTVDTEDLTVTTTVNPSSIPPHQSGDNFVSVANVQFGDRKLLLPLTEWKEYPLVLFFCGKISDTETMSLSYDALGDSWIATVDTFGQQYVDELATDLQEQIGNPNELHTTDKSNLVSAINELADGGGGGGGSSDYDDLSNKPQINGTTLTGNKSAADLGLSPAGAYVKPSGGIPASDMASAVQTSLSRADASVQYNSQTLSDSQKAQARDNIGAASVDDLGTVFDIKGDVATVSDLPATGNRVGDVYYVQSVSAAFVWLETTAHPTGYWEEFGEPIDLSGYIEKPSSASANQILTFNGSAWVAANKPTYTASDVGAVAVAQGVSHAGEFVVVGSDGNITTVTMSVWQGGSF